MSETSELLSFRSPCLSLLWVCVFIFFLVLFFANVVLYLLAFAGRGKYRARGQDERGGKAEEEEEGGWGTLGSESSTEERNKFINNKGDVTSG